MTVRSVMVLLLNSIEWGTVVVIFFIGVIDFCSIPSIFNVIPIILKIFCVINLLTLWANLLHKKGGSCMFYTVHEKQPLLVDPFY